MGKLIQSAIAGVVAAICGASIGYGVSQSSVGQKVEGQQVAIVNLRESDIAIRADLLETRKQYSEDLKSLRELVGRVIDQNRELVSVLRAQNELINRNGTTRQP